MTLEQKQALLSYLGYYDGPLDGLWGEKSKRVTIGANMDAASLIHLVAGDTLRVKGVNIPDASDGAYTSVVKYNADGTYFSAAYLWEGCSFNTINFHNDANGIVAMC